MSTFEKSVTEQHQEVKRRELWHVNLDGYDVFFTPPTPTSSAELTIATDSRSALYFGILNSHPHNVDALEKFAKDAPALLIAVAEMLRAEGMTDLRAGIARLGFPLERASVSRR